MGMIIDLDSTEDQSHGRPEKYLVPFDNLSFHPRRRLSRQNYSTSAKNMSKVKYKIYKLAIYCLFISLYSVFCSRYSYSETYYVSPDGSDKYKGTLSKPFKTIQKAADIVQAGDTVIVKNGIYQVYDNDPDHHWSVIVSLKKGGTLDNWITFKSENKYGAIIDGQDNKTTHGWIFSGGACYIRVEGFEVKGFKYGGFYSYKGCHDIHLIGNHIHDIGRECTESPNGNFGIYQDAGTTNHIYENNIFHDIGRLSHGHPYDSNHDHAIYVGGGSNGSIINNSFYNIKAGWPIHFYSGSSYNDIEYWEISNNFFAYPVNDRYGHIIITGRSRKIKINNNISYNPQKCFVSLYYLSGKNNIEINNNYIYGKVNVIYNDSQYIDTYEHDNTINPLLLMPPKIMNQRLFITKIIQ